MTLQEIEAELEIMDAQRVAAKKRGAELMLMRHQIIKNENDEARREAAEATKGMNEALALKRAQRVKLHPAIVGPSGAAIKGN